MSEEWVSWFGQDGLARHYRADTAIGREIVARLAEAEAATGRLCPAPKAMFPNQVCGGRVIGRKGQRYCSEACKKRALRAAVASPMSLETESGPGSARGPISRDIASRLPGAMQATFGSPVPR